MSIILPRRKGRRDEHCRRIGRSEDPARSSIASAELLLPPSVPRSRIVPSL